MKKTVIAFLFSVICLSMAANPIKFVSLDDYPLLGNVRGHVDDKDAFSHRYYRLPDSLQGKVRDQLWELSRNPAGMSIRFRTDASNIRLRWKSLNKTAMHHMTPVGIRGLDLYVRDNDGSWTFLGSGRPAINNYFTTNLVMENMVPEMRDYMLFLSLYDGVDSISVGVDSIATVEPAVIEKSYTTKPVVMYGTSIMQGGCANRPGMAHTNILQRMLDHEVINLGFSGNGRLDPELAEVIASVDGSVYVIDPLPNLSPEQLKERIQPFYDILRAKRPDTPILFVESPMFPYTRFNVKLREEITEKNAILRAWYESLNDPNAYYFEAKDILKGNNEATVDNVHFTDLGFTIFAESLYPVLKQFVND